MREFLWEIMQNKPTLAVWKSNKSLNTFLTFVSRYVWFAGALSIFVTCNTVWTFLITITVWKDYFFLIFYWRMKWFIVRYTEKYLLLQFGNPKNPTTHFWHLLPKMCADLQEHFPSLSSHLVPLDPFELQLHPINQS